MDFLGDDAAKNHALNDVIGEMCQAVQQAERHVASIFDRLKMDELKNFDLKKKITSAVRRIAPIGLSTTIGWSANPRTLRWVIDQRTSRFAEVEIRKVFEKVALLCIERYPNLFGDLVGEEIDGIFEFKSAHRKV